MEIGTTKRQGKPKTRREHSTEPDSFVQLRNVAFSWNGALSERPSSRLGCYDGSEDPFLSSWPEERRACRSDEDGHDSTYRSARKRRSSKRHHYKRKQAVAKAKQKKRSALESSSDHGSGSRVLKKVARGWTELFSTISEQPTIEEAEQDKYNYLANLHVFPMSTLTLRACGSSDRSSSVTLLQPPATATGFSPKDVLALCPPDPMPDCGVLPEGCVPSTPAKQVAKSGSNQSCRGTLGQAEQSLSVGALEEKEMASMSTNESFAPPRFLFGELHPTLWSQREEEAGQDILTGLSTILECFDYGSASEAPPAGPPKEEGVVPNVHTSNKEASEKLPGSSDAFEKLAEHDRVVHPDRTCALVLAVGLLVAVFIVASLFSASGSYPSGLLSQHSSGKAANVKLEMEATNLGAQRRTPPKVGGTTVARTTHATSTVSSRTLVRQLALININDGLANTTNDSDNASPIASKQPFVELTSQSRPRTLRNGSTETVPASSTAALSNLLVSRPSPLRDKRINHHRITTVGDNDGFI